MVRLALIGLFVITACRDRAKEPGAAVATSPAPPAASSALPASYARVIGAKPAMLGPALAGLKLGTPVTEEAIPEVPGTSFVVVGEVAPRFVRRASDAEPKVLVNLELRSGTLFAIRIELYTAQGSIPDDRCAGVAQALEAMWGPAPERVWVDRAAHVRAALLHTCIVTFERYVDLAAWIGRGPSSIIPVAAVGKPASSLASRVGPDANLEHGVTFRAAGLGEHAQGPTMIDVYLAQGKVSGLGVETAVPASERAAIRDHITSAFAATPARDAVTGYDVWATTPPIRMLETQAGVRIEVGTLTP